MFVIVIELQEVVLENSAAPFVEEQRKEMFWKKKARDWE